MSADETPEEEYATPEEIERVLKEVAKQTGSRSNEKFAGQVPDLYDHEMVKVRDIHVSLEQRYPFYKLAHNPALCEEYVKVAADEFLRIGLVAQVDTSEILFGVGSARITIVSRVAGHSDGIYGHDFERHRRQVLEANELGESFRGEKFKFKE